MISRTRRDHPGQTWTRGQNGSSYIHDPRSMFWRKSRAHSALRSYSIRRTPRGQTWTTNLDPRRGFAAVGPVLTRDHKARQPLNSKIASGAPTEISCRKGRAMTDLIVAGISVPDQTKFTAAQTQANCLARLQEISRADEIRPDLSAATLRPITNREIQS